MDAIRAKIVQTIDGPGVQSIIAGFFGVVAHLDTCATALAIIVLSIQVAGMHCWRSWMGTKLFSGNLKLVRCAHLKRLK